MWLVFITWSIQQWNEWKCVYVFRFIIGSSFGENMLVLFNFGIRRISHYAQLYCNQKLHASNRRIPPLPVKTIWHFHIVRLSWRSENRNDASSSKMAHMDLFRCGKGSKFNHRWLRTWWFSNCLSFFVFQYMLWFPLWPSFFKGISRVFAWFCVPRSF